MQIREPFDQDNQASQKAGLRRCKLQLKSSESSKKRAKPHFETASRIPAGILLGVAVLLPALELGFREENGQPK